MEQNFEEQDKKAEKQPFYKRFKAPTKNIFWVWVAYQCAKGLTTTTVIWLPLLYMWWHSSHH